MKDYIQDEYGGQKMSYDKLRAVVKETWDTVPDDYLSLLMTDMTKPMIYGNEMVQTLAMPPDRLLVEAAH